MAKTVICKNPTCPRKGKPFRPQRAGAQYCGDACRMAAHRHRIRTAQPPEALWLGDVPQFSTRPSKLTNADGTPALTRGELAERLLEIAERDDGGEPKTGRRYYYLALSHGYVQPDMSDSPFGRKSREDAYERVTTILGILRKQGRRLPWNHVLDLTRELVEWQTFESVRDAREQLRRTYTEDRWIGQPWFPILVIEKDTMVPVCEPMAQRWQMKFASSRGYASLKLQHDVAQMIRHRRERYGQRSIVYFVSDHDPSGLDLQAAWEEALRDFGASAIVIRIGLTREQVTDSGLSEQLQQGIEVKPSDSRAEKYVAAHGGRCWEVDILPAAVIERAIDDDIESWLDTTLWNRRSQEIEQARSLL
jgi:hypothetical protein